jgi:hypothetical protein
LAEVSGDVEGGRDAATPSGLARLEEYHTALLKVPEARYIYVGAGDYQEIAGRIPHVVEGESGLRQMIA